MNRTLKRDITDEQMRAYDEDGVVLIRGALDAEWVERAREAMERCYETPTPWGQNVNAEGTPGRMLFDRLCCKPDVGVSQTRTTTVLSSCFCVGQTVL